VAYVHVLVEAWYQAEPPQLPPETGGGGKPSHPIAPGGPNPPVDPGYGRPGWPDQGLPIGPSHPIAPGGPGNKPDQGLPIHPSHPIAPGGPGQPGQPPGIWGGQPPNWVDTTPPTDQPGIDNTLPEVPPHVENKPIEPVPQPKPGSPPPAKK
jgi:integrin beta 8